MKIEDFMSKEFDAHASCDGYGQLSVSYNQTDPAGVSAHSGNFSLNISAWESGDL